MHSCIHALFTKENPTNTKPSGVGLGIGQRIIDDFLATRSLTSHLILIPTTRSVQKSRDAIRSLRAHLETIARTSERLRSRSSTGSSNSESYYYDPQTVIDRVHILSVQLDLCDLRSVYGAADQLVRGRLSDPTGVIGEEVAIPRLDAAIFNAGIGGWKGLDWGLFARQLLAVGLVQATTFPSFKEALPAAVLDRKKLLGVEAEAEAEASSPPTELAEVFCANVFGHYILAHELMPLLGRPPSGSGSSTGNGKDEQLPPGRVIWTSSIDACEEHLDLSDFQARAYKPPYESSKRITDVISLTASLPTVRPFAASYFSLEPSSSSSSSSSVSSSSITTTTTIEDWEPPRFYLSHPGIVCTPLFPLNWFLYFWYHVAMYLSRWLGSPWHTVEPYVGACASAWLALADQAELDARDASRVKWGSACARSSGDRAGPKKTEVEGWGWEGRVGEMMPGSAVGEGEDEKGFLNKAKGRKWDARLLTDERKARFEDDGQACWAELERLRREWEVALGRR